MSEKIATKRVLTNRGFEYEGPGEWFEVYEELTPQNWAEILEEIERETAGIGITGEHPGRENGRNGLSGSTPLPGTRELTVKNLQL